MCPSRCTWSRTWWSSSTAGRRRAGQSARAAQATTVRKLGPPTASPPLSCSDPAIQGSQRNCPVTNLNSYSPGGRTIDTWRGCRPFPPARSSRYRARVCVSALRRPSSALSQLLKVPADGIANARVAVGQGQDDRDQLGGGLSLGRRVFRGRRRRMFGVGNQAPDLRDQHLQMSVERGRDRIEPVGDVEKILEIARRQHVLDPERYDQLALLDGVMNLP